MKQPDGPNSHQSPLPSSNGKSTSTATLASASGGGGGGDGGGGSQKSRIPTPQELISHYESQGLETQEAAIKVIDDLQRVLFRTVTSGRGRKDKSMAEVSKKLDNVNTRLAIVEMKLDSKPGYPGFLALGVLSAASFRGIASVWPHVAGAAAHIWNSVRGSTTSSAP
ncbi:hypothetical protein Dimus_036851 [Dionaea muscipula]